MSARFQWYRRSDGWYWRLLGANNRTLGRSAAAAGDLRATKRDAADLASLSPTARIDVVGDGRGWSWVLTDGRRVRAVSAGAYVRRLDCTRSIARFRSSASAAELSDVVLADRNTRDPRRQDPRHQDPRHNDRVTTLQHALAAGPVLLDGGLATELERRGHDLSGDLWSAALLASAPEEVRDTHAAYFAAGARVATTASYQASLEGFAAAGIDRQQAEALITRSVTLAQQARADTGLDGQAWVAGSVGPYGAVLAGGQEYTGVYPAPFDTVTALRAFHRPRLEVLLAAGADVLACETLPSLTEVEAVLRELEALGAPAWVSLTTVTGDAGQVLTRRGEDAGEAFAMAADVRSVFAVGVNCTAPSGVGAAVSLAEARSGLPVVVYPNSGETWDAAHRVWVGRPGLDPRAARGWVAAGARLVGGCCRIGPADIAALASSAVQRAAS